MRFRGLMMSIITTLLLISTTAIAAEIGAGKRLGIGLGGGTTTSGLTVKYYLAPAAAVQVFLGQRWNYGTSVGADYIMEFGPLAQGAPGKLFWGAGVGAGLLLYNRNRHSSSEIAISGVLQLGWHFKQIPLELIADWRPTFFIGDNLGGLWLGGGGGAIRWFF